MGAAGSRTQAPSALGNSLQPRGFQSTGPDRPLLPANWPKQSLCLLVGCGWACLRWRGERQVLRPGLTQVIALTVLASVRIYYQYRRVKPVTREIVIRDPYALRPLRRLIDAYAFRIYGHWVKKGQQQNRAALFENTPKAVLLLLAEDEDY